MKKESGTVAYTIAKMPLKVYSLRPLIIALKKVNENDTRNVHFQRSRKPKSRPRSTWAKNHSKNAAGSDMKTYATARSAAAITNSPTREAHTMIMAVSYLSCHSSVVTRRNVRASASSVPHRSFKQASPQLARTKVSKVGCGGKE